MGRPACSNAVVLIAGLINTAAIVVGSLVPIPLLINLYSPEVYRDYLSFMAFAGLFAFSNLMFPQDFSDLVSRRRLEAFPVIVQIAKYNVVLSVVIGVFLIFIFGNVDIGIFLSALVFSLVRSVGFTVSAGFSGYGEEWIDKGILSPLLHLAPVLAIPSHLFLFPEVGYFEFLNALVFLLVCFFFSVSISKAYIKVSFRGSYTLDLSRSVVVFLTFNVTSVFWLSYPLVSEVFLPGIDIVSFSVAFKIFAFASSVSTPVLLAFWTRWSDFKALPIFRGVYWIVIVFIGLAFSFQFGVYENYLDLLGIVGLDHVNKQNANVLLMLGLFGVFRILSNIGVVMVSRYVSTVFSLIVLCIAEFGSWGCAFLLYRLGVFVTGEMLLVFGFWLSSLIVLGASAVLVRRECEDRFYR